MPSFQKILGLLFHIIFCGCEFWIPTLMPTLLSVHAEKITLHQHACAVDSDLIIQSQIFFNHLIYQLLLSV